MRDKATHVDKTEKLKSIVTETNSMRERILKISKELARISEERNILFS